MELQNAIVAHHLDELRALARQLRAERRRERRASTAPGLSRLRIALGRRLVAAGTALLDSASARATAIR